MNKIKLLSELQNDLDFQSKLNVFDISPNWPLAFFVEQEIRDKLGNDEGIVDFHSLAKALGDNGLSELALIIADVREIDINGVKVWATKNAGPASKKIIFEPNLLSELFDDLKQI